MSKLEDLQPSAAVRGILPNCLVTVVKTEWFGSEALELTYKDPAGKLANELLYRHDEPRIEAEIASGAPENVVRIVTENSRTLKFTSQGFEAE